MCLGLQLPGQTSLLFFPLFLTKIHLLWPFKPHPPPFIHVQHTLPQSFVLALFIFVYLLQHVSMLLHFIHVAIQRAHTCRYLTLLSMQNEMVPELLFITSLASSSFPPPLVFPFLPPSFFFSPFLSFFFPSFPSFFLSFSNLEALNLGARERAKSKVLLQNHPQRYQTKFKKLLVTSHNE